MTLVYLLSWVDLIAAFFLMALKIRNFLNASEDRVISSTRGPALFLQSIGNWYRAVVILFEGVAWLVLAILIWFGRNMVRPNPTSPFVRIILLIMIGLEVAKLVIEQITRRNVLSVLERRSITRPKTGMNLNGNEKGDVQS